MFPCPGHMVVVPPPKPAPLSPYHSLRWRLPVLIVALIVLVLGAFAWTTYGQLRRTLVETGETRARGAADELAGLLAPASQQRSADLKRAAADPAVRDAILLKQTEHAEAFQALQPLSASGRQVIELWTREGARLMAIETPANTESVFPPSLPPVDSPLRLASANGVVVADLIEPVRDAERQEVIGHLVVRRPVATSSSSSDTLNRLIGGGARIHLGGGSGQWTDMTAIIEPSALERAVRPGVASYTGRSGDQRVEAISQVAGTPWLVSVEFPLAGFMAPARTFLLRTVFIAVLLVIVAGGLSHFAVSRITKPLADLTAASEAIASGDFGRRVEGRRPDELGRLGAAFNSMVDQIQEAHAHLLLAVQGSKIGIWEWDIPTDQMYLSPQFEQLLGFERGELPSGRSAMTPLIHPDDRDRVLQEIESRVSGATATYESEHRLRRKDGTYAWILAHGEISRDAAGRALRMAGTVIDTTVQRTARDEALAQARQAAFVADVATALTEGRNLPQMLSRCADAMVRHLDAAVARMWTVSLTEPILELQASAGESTVSMPDRIQMGALLAGRVASERKAIVDNAIDLASDPALADFSPPGCHSYAGLPLIVDQKLVGVISMLARRPLGESALGSLESVARTIALGIERQRLSESRSRFEDLLESATDFVTIGQVNGPPVYVNRAARQALGLSPTDSIRSLLDFRPAGYREFFETVVLPAASRQGGWRGRTEYVSRSGTRIPVSQVSIVHTNSAGDVQYISTISRDISDELRVAKEREVLEEQLQRTQRIEAVGQLAGGLAHDFNNLLTIVLGFANVLGDQLPAGDALQKDVAQIQGAAQRASQLTRQLLAFSRKQVLNPVLLDPAAVIHGLRPMLSRLVGESIEVSLNCDPQASAITFDPSQLELILVNLVINARDAMPNGGRVTIDLADVDLDEQFCRTHLAVEPGRYVRLSVTDTGVGIDEATKKRIFEPFFTTKARDKGTGLGLATVFGIVKQSGGSVWVYSEPGLGASFKIFLPASRTAKPAQSSRAPNKTIPAGRERVLVVEDEPGVRVLVETVLNKAGYSVHSAAHPAEALQYANPGESIDILITDVVMPGMNGVALARELCKSRPHLRVLFMSGFADDAIEHHGALSDGQAFLQKPFTRLELAQKVRDVLDGEAAGVQ